MDGSAARNPIWMFAASDSFLHQPFLKLFSTLFPLPLYSRLHSHSPFLAPDSQHE